MSHPGSPGHRATQTVARRPEHIDKDTKRSNAARSTNSTLTADFVRRFPGGSIDDSTFERIEEALDRVDAPCQNTDGRWLTLPERISALAAELGRISR